MPVIRRTTFREIMPGILCPYCGHSVEKHDSTKIYGSMPSFGAIVVCSRYPECDSYVGCYANGKPKGSLANAPLRAARKEAHEAFDKLWKSKFMTRTAAYDWLARTMKLHKDVCHIGMFDQAQCAEVVRVVHEFGTKYDLKAVY